jgi:hypothetical protein
MAVVAAATEVAVDSRMDREPAADAVIRGAVAIANRILQGEVEPDEGARNLARIHADLASLEQALQVFVALDDNWDDLPERRADVAHEIVLEADRFRADWGP